MADAIARVPPLGERIEVRVRELLQLFNVIDPSPFHYRDLDPAADEFIENWASDLPGSARLSLVVYVDQPTETGAEETLRKAVQQYYGRKADAARRRLRELFRRGRSSLAIALLFLVVLGTLAGLVADRVPGTVGLIAREGLLILGWVAMWRPLEVFLYDWWPIRAQARLYDRLAAMPVQIQQQQS